MKEACVSLLASLNTSVRCALEKVKPESAVSSAQQRAWHGVRAQSTAFLVTSFWQGFACFHDPGSDGGISSKGSSG